ncbi:hypothetical protein QE152_g1872 [Popillia japonica]|uniref:Uncharacterized protein n=1 Tax=Popillia japonica TaxID=7064 RepID=A0AAW1N7T5_POPJA
MDRNLISYGKITNKNKIVSVRNISKIYNPNGKLIALALCNKQIVDGLPIELESDYLKCGICVQNKMHNLPFKNERSRAKDILEIVHTDLNGPHSRAKEILEIVHTDLNGPHSIVGLNGEKYFLTFIDDYSKVAKTYIIKSKESKTGKRVKRVRCDNGKEYMNKDIYSFARERGISIEPCPPYVHELNGTAEKVFMMYVTFNDSNIENDKDENNMVEEVNDQNVELGLRDSENWEIAMDKEMNCLIKNQTWGENFTIKCFSESNTKQKTKFTYSWTKNRILLPIATENEQYEILYPVGSILQVYNINKSTTFSCLVQHELLSSEMGISVNVVYGNSHLTCLGEGHLNVLWPETAAGTESLQECPRGYSGIARRFCSIRDAGQPTWQMPDYSDCMPNALLEVDTNFQRMKLGYSDDSTAKTLTIYLKYLDKHLHVLPGEGARILSLVSDVINFIATINTIGTREISISIMQIVDKILTYQHSLVRESQVLLLQRILKRQAQLINSHPVFHRSFTTLDVTLAPQDKAGGAVAGAAPGAGASVIRIPDPENRYPKWFFYKLHLNLRYNYSTNTSATVAVVAYRNLSAFLPARSVIRLKDDTEMEYEILSKIASVWVLKATEDVSRKTNDGDVSRENVETLLSMEFSHPAKNSTLGLWNVNCAVTDFASYGYTWNVQGCRTRILDSSTTRCTCSRTGTFAVLMTKRPNYNREEQETKHLIVLVGCATCLALALISCFALLACWIVRRTCLEFIKIQCCCSITGAMIVFMYSLGGDLAASSYLYIMSFLESFLLTAMSSQLCKLLVVYTEIMQLQRMGSIKQTVVLIITGKLG